MCVLKSYQKWSLSQQDLSQVAREVHLHSQLDTQHVVPLWAAVDDGTQVHLIMQYASKGDLRSIMQRGPLAESYVRDQVVLPLLQALAELHAKGYVHRDVKPENVFMADNGALLGDFNLAFGPLSSTRTSTSLPTSPARSSCRCSCSSSKSLLAPCSSCSLSESDLAAGDAADAGSDADQNSDLAPSLSLSSSRDSVQLSGCASLTSGAVEACGTPAYCAPEVVSAAFCSTPMCEAVCPQNDVWSLGIMAAECLGGQHPLGDTSAASCALISALSSSSSSPLGLSRLQVSPHCKDWLAAALLRDPRQRWSAARLLQHPWISTAAHKEGQEQQAAQTGATAAAAPAAAAAAGTASGPGSKAAGAVASGSSSNASKMTLKAAGAAQPQHHAAAAPPWVEDDWVSGVNSLLHKASSSQGPGPGPGMCQCRHQEQQGQQQQGGGAVPCVQQCGALAFSSWED